MFRFKTCWVINTLKDTDDTSVHDRVLVDYESGGPWNPQTFYPGESNTSQLKSGTVFNLANPSAKGYPSSINVYFWINDAKLNSYSPAQYGMTISLGEDQIFRIDDSAPGTIFPVGGIGKRFIAPIDSYNFGIYNVKNVTVTNATNAELPFFINYQSSQPFPISLSDFPASNSTGKMVKGGKLTYPLYNNVGSPPNSGIYFYANGAAPTDPAIAATAISLSDSGIQNINSTYAKVTNTNNSFIVTSTGIPPPTATPPVTTSPPTTPLTTPSTTPPTPPATTPSDTSDSSSPSKHIWIWVGVAIGIIALIVVIAVCMHSHNKSATKY